MQFKFNPIHYSQASCCSPHAINSTRESSSGSSWTSLQDRISRIPSAKEFVFREMAMRFLALICVSNEVQTNVNQAINQSIQRQNKNEQLTLRLTKNKVEKSHSVQFPLKNYNFSLSPQTNYNQIKFLPTVYRSERQTDRQTQDTFVDSPILSLNHWKNQAHNMGQPITRNNK